MIHSQTVGKVRKDVKLAKQSQVVEMLARGAGHKDIASAVGASLSWVYRLSHECGWHARIITDVEWNEIRARRKQRAAA
mgnify:CR=1 FL=1